MLDSQLLASRGGYVGGRWVSGPSRRTLKIRNPATGELLARVPEVGRAETREAIAAGVAALSQEVSLEQRREWLVALHDALLSHQEELARIITLENGKPLKEARTEVDYAAGFFRFFAAVLSHLEPRVLPERIRGCRWTVHARPAGVVGLITPWNFPLAMLAKKLAAALAAGCSVVAKPAERTPLTPIALWHLLERTGFPPGRLNLVLGQPGPIGLELCQHPDVRLISFTGSTEVGRLLLARSAAHVKRLTLELGGNAPFIVFADADLRTAADALVANKFRASGQTCVCTNRVYVQQEVLQPFTQILVDRVSNLRVGNGLDPETDVGPLINRAGFDKVAAHVADALASGAQRLVGADPSPPARDWGCFYPPTLLTGVTPEMRVCREETFGPVIGMSAFTDESQAVTLANQTPAGLAAYVFSGNPARAETIIRQLKFGHVGFNTGTGPTPEAPFGGMKQSGFGREGGLEGLLEFIEPQAVACGDDSLSGA